MKNAYSFIFIYTCLVFICNGQALQQIPHPPSKEIYDLLVDKKGFIWVAHDLGVSRYDGISFTSFANSNQTAISMTDLIEDNYGRIWCHNFNGQIFYIQNEKMFYLKEYDFKQESIFPSMALFDDELIITTIKGLFVCDTKTLNCKYIVDTTLREKRSYFGSIGLCVLTKEVLIYANENRWYTYSKNNGFKKIRSGLNLGTKIQNLAKLQPKANGDTAFLVDKKEELIYGVTVKNNVVTPVLKKSVGGVINTVKVVNGQTWINSTQISFTLSGGDTIKNHNITAIRLDADGNTWFSSLTEGLLVHYKETGWQQIKLRSLASNDYIRNVQANRKYLVLCSQSGKIILDSGNQLENCKPVFLLPAISGSPQNLQLIGDNNFIIENSQSIYILAATAREIRCIDSTASTRDVAISGKVAWLANANRMVAKNTSSWGLGTSADFPNIFTLSSKVFEPYFTITNTREFKKIGRCRAVAYDSSSHSLLAALADGLLQLNTDSAVNILYRGEPLYVSSMANYKKKIYAGTFNKGLFIINRGRATKVTDDNQSQLDAIIKVKCCNNHIWIFRTHDIEVFDADNGIFLNKISPFPIDAAEVKDVEEFNGKIYLATMQGLFADDFPEKKSAISVAPTFLYLLVNNTDTLYNDNVTLKNYKNNLVFQLSIPVYKNADQVQFRYRLNGNNNDSTWYYTKKGQRDVQFNALKAGNYSIEVYVVNSSIAVTNRPLVYHFIIEQPWYNTIWFYCSLVALCALLFWGIYQYRLRQVFKIERIRRKISNDLHDDIGSTLSSINIYSQLAKGNSSNNEYINTIQASTVEIINNLDDLVWNINPKNDILQQLLNRMQLFAMPLLSEKGIECTFKIKIEDGEILVSPDLRANIFLLFKEIVNNVVKHSNASTCKVNIIQTGKSFLLTVKDDGKGFDTKNIKTHRNGLQSMAQRAKDMKGALEIYSEPGIGTEIRLDCYVK